MPSYASATPEPFASFERGMDREDPRTDISKGGYDYAVNVLLRDQFQGGTHIASMAADLAYDLSPVTNPALDGTPTYLAPFTYSTYTNGTLAFATHVLVTTSTGVMNRLDTSPFSKTLVRRGLNAAQQYWTHATFDQWLILCNGRDAPMKYGQHFLVDGMTEARPFAFPLGSKPITPCGPAISTETWTQGGSSGFVADASVPGGGSRVHTQSLKVSSSQNSYVEWAKTRDFITGPYPYGGTDFTDTDFLILQVFCSGSTTLRIRFSYTGLSEYFQWTVPITSSSSWQTLRLQVSDATYTVTPVSPETTAEASVRVSKAVKRLTFFNDGATDIYVDDVYFLYGNAPPAFQVATYHKNRLLGGGAPIAGNSTPALATLFWSRAAFPDEYPAENTLVISGGSNALSRANQITAMHEFGPSVLIGTPHSITSFTLDTQGNPIQQAVTNEHGIDSHRAMVETPNGALIFPWQKGMYVIRATWRALGSNKVAPLFDFVWQVEPHWTVGVYDEKTQTLRWWFRLKDPLGVGAPDPANTNFGIVFDYVRAQELGEGVWPSVHEFDGEGTNPGNSTFADFAFPFYINGKREVLYGRYGSSSIRRMGVVEYIDSSNPALGRHHLKSQVDLPWMARETKDTLTKQMGLTVPYAARENIEVWARYAQHPQEFESSTWSHIQDLPPNVHSTDDQGRILLGGTARWTQIRFVCQKARGMELFPPIALHGLTTSRQP